MDVREIFPGDWNGRQERERLGGRLRHPARRAGVDSGGRDAARPAGSLERWPLTHARGPAKCITGV